MKHLACNEISLHLAMYACYKEDVRFPNSQKKQIKINKDYEKRINRDGRDSEKRN